MNNQIIKKILFTLGILVAYRIGTHVSLPFVDISKLAEFAELNKEGFFAMMNTFSGGSMSRVAIFGLGVMPYITASIIIQLLSASVESLKQLRTEGGLEGQRTIAQYTKLLTIFIALMHGFVFSNGFISAGVYVNKLPVGTLKIISAVIMMIGTMILLWMGDMCSTYGVGNGTSLIIFAGIVAELPRDLGRTFELAKNGNIGGFAVVVLFLLFFLTIMAIVYIERSNRLLYVQYPRQAMNFMAKAKAMPKENFIPFKLNTAGVVPPIFASAILMLPLTLINAIGMQGGKVGAFIANNLSRGSVGFVFLYAVFIIFFTFFYSNVLFDPTELSDNLKKSNVFVPGCRPGTATANLIRSIIIRLAYFGSAYLVIICLIPEIFGNTYGHTFLLGGTSLLIAIGVVMDTIVNVQTSMLSSKYTKMMKRYDR